ncbi:ABC transporter substrate-binding protein [Erysipelothrix sp. HDW6C]|uniref:ABC transporter substrate-binding protein n=1 Tax=Erysipelothrix sp. HDW6C TaxID=2714930 RepID=UPI00140DC561|nr:ABC transporter substrate-binding protein [Erysipelothrix sp. HDW6C]QIK70545.1 ABC transporter substrate-binding protein [Erysipelothrix sp. HDW6C]
MKKTIVALLVLLMVLTGCGSNGNGDKLKIGVLQLAEHPSLDATYNGMVEMLNELVGEENYVVDLQNAQGDLTNADMMANKFVNDKVDVIYAIGTNAAQSAYNAAEAAGIPVVFNAVTDPVAADLVETMEKPGRNVTGVSDISPAKKQLSIVKEILPNAKKIGVVYNVGEVNSMVQIEVLQSVAGELGLEIVVKGVSNVQDITLAAQQLSSEVDAFYNITDNMVVAAMASIVDVANTAKLPVFASEDGQFDEGLLATESLSYHALGREAGTIINDILKNGKKAADIPVVTSDSTVLYVNEDVAKTLGIVLPESVLSRKAER